jgi:hypothetical protein
VAYEPDKPSVSLKEAGLLRVVDHKQRDLAQDDREVAALISHGHAGEYQRVVPNELPRRNPDLELRMIEG